jgi:Membrane domain of glycerophosphoryl diester phosphodiesterase
MTDVVRAAESNFRVGRTLSNSWRVFSANFVKVFLITIVVTAVYVGLSRFVPRSAVPSSEVPKLAVLIVIGVLAILILYTLAQAAILYVAFQSMRGRVVGIAEALRRGLSRFGAIVGLAILVGFGIWIGLILLIVPGIMFALRWSVALPACVVEGLGPLASMKRSAQLTKGHRWKLFGIFLLLWVVSALAGLLIGLLLKPAGVVVTQVVQAVWNAAWTAFWYVTLVMIYHDLRVIKEGVDIDQIAAVFD